MQKSPNKPNIIKANLSFLNQFLRNPKEIGSIVPSSPLLGKTMANFVPQTGSELVVELGPGTGPITKALLKSGLSENNLICLEQSARMVKHLQARFPQIQIIHGDACELSKLLADKCGRISAVVSSLPLKSIPSEIVDQIIEQVYQSLEINGLMIQFTYDLRKNKSPLLKRFKRVDSKVVLGNIPPARVCLFQKIE